MRSARAAALLAVLVAARPAAAEPPEPLRYDLAVDASVTAAAAALWIGSEALKADLAPSACRWCDPGSLDAWARGKLVWGDVKAAQRASDVLAFAVLPAAAAANALLSAHAAGDTSAGWVDLLLVLEAVAITEDVTQLAKFTVGRQRPFVHYGNSEAGRAPQPDDNLSFFSGHSSMAFSLAAAAGTVSTMRGYRSAPWVWGIGMGLAAATGYLRIAGDKHYLTDVLVGAAVGTGLGIAIPRLLHPREAGDPAPGAARILPTLGGIVIVF
jgi:membrane-associated phospholipid phosphatase